METIKAVMKSPRPMYTGVCRSTKMSNHTADMVALARALQEQAEAQGCKDAFFLCDWIIRKWGDGKDTSEGADTAIVRAMNFLENHKVLAKHWEFLKQISKVGE